ncbi:hypothetical protein [Streptomyces sp. RerS4]|uniref:hypothetical protein n=1 Tax=Streptomyces sp. RerS4 TaxID=2942449 RepID=UPI00201C9385|nr:hypothetical protein [Streptomyces sp. RerS4]UQX04242.1 hypothetical protein M4D82_29870 [Streptomyces sp. RerS4]
MSTGTLIAIIVVAAVVILALTVTLVVLAQRRRLRERFGPEYGRAVREKGGKLAAERELRSREHRHDKLELKELPAGRRHQYADEWRDVQERFVDRPETAVSDADALVTRLMRERGYPTDGTYDDRLRDLSVQHGSTLNHYRDAHAVKTRSAEGSATTEELRGAMVHYRALFAELLEDERSH